MKIRTIVTDMDDTLLRDDLSISPYTLDVLGRAMNRGVGLVLASGRSPASILSFSDVLRVNRPMIACNGAVIVDPDTGAELDRRLFNVTDARACARFAKENGCYVQVYYGDKFYFSNRCKWSELYGSFSRLEGVCVGDVEAFIQEPTSKLILVAEPAVIEQLYPVAMKRFAGCASVTISKPQYLEFLAPGSTKGDALERMTTLCDIDRESTIAFGDSMNDLTMLQWAGIGVAMGNARPEVRAVADRVCDSNDKDGIARLIERLVLCEEESA